MSYSATRRKRFTAGVLAGAMALTVMPILGFTGVAGADHIETADPIGDGNVCEDAPAEDPFTDVGDDDIAVNEIRCMVNAGPEQITHGTTATTYSPNDPVTRRQMVLFLWRVGQDAEAHEVGDAVTALPEGDGSVPFSDIEDDDPAFPELDSLNEAVVDGQPIADGFPDGTFRPNSPVSRRQMAHFIVRLQRYLAGADFPPEPSEDYFDDDNGDTGEESLNILAEEGVFTGVAEPHGNVEPGEDITRRQMAFVLTRKLEVLFEGGIIGRLFAEDDTNQTLAVSPAETTTAGFDQTSGTSEIVEVTIAGADPAGEYDVALFPCYEFGQGNPSAYFDDGENLVDLNGVSHTDAIISFYDRDFDDVADDAGAPEGGADIVSVNFDNNAGVPDPYFEDQTPDADGELLVRVQSSGGITDCVYVVAWEDADDDDALLLNNGTADVENDDTPAVPFGISGAITWTSGEAPNGYAMGDDVFFVDQSMGNWIDESGWTINYDDADTFTYSGSDVSGVISMSVFEGFLSHQDGIGTTAGTYSQVNPVAFDMFDDMGFGLSNAPTVEVLGDDDEEDDGDEVLVSWTEQADPGADVDSYDVEIRDAATGAFVTSGSTAPVNTLGGGDAVTELMFSDLADGAYVARIQANTETGYVSSNSPFSAPFTTGAAADTEAPTIVEANRTTDAGILGRLDAGDEWELVFSEEMAPATATSGVFVVDDGADEFSVDCGDANVTCTLGGTSNEELAIVFGGAFTTGGDVISYPVTITTTNDQVEDLAGNDVDLAGSADVTIP